MASQEFEPKKEEEKKSGDNAYWTSPGVVKDGFVPILNVQVGTFVVRKRQDRNGVTCFELFEIVSTPNARQFSIYIYVSRFLLLFFFALAFLVS